MNKTSLLSTTMKKLLLFLPLFVATIALGMDNTTKIVYQPASLKRQAALKIPHDLIKGLSPELSGYVKDHQNFNSDIEIAKQVAVDQSYMRELDRLCYSSHNTARLEELYLERPHVFTQNNNHGLLLKICVQANNIPVARWLLEKIPVLKQDYAPDFIMNTGEYLLQFLLIQTATKKQNNMATVLLEYATDPIVHNLYHFNNAGQGCISRTPYQFCAQLAHQYIRTDNFQMLDILLKKFPSMDLSPALGQALNTNKQDAYLHLLPYVEKEFKDNPASVLAKNYYVEFKQYLPCPDDAALLHLKTIFSNQTIKDILQPEIIKCLSNLFYRYLELDVQESYAQFLMSVITPSQKNQLSKLLNSCLKDICTHKIIRSKETLAYLKFVLRNGADTLTTDHNGKIPLQLLLERPHHELVTPPTIIQGFGRHWHTNELGKAVKYLLKTDGYKQVTHTDPEGNTALHTVGAALVMGQLLDHNGNINHRNNKGETPTLVYVKENIEDWQSTLYFYGDGHKDYDGECMQSDLYHYLQSADSSIPNHQGNTVLGYLSALKTNSENKYFAKTVISLFKQSKKRVQWQQQQLKPVANATFQATFNKKMVAPVNVGNPLYYLAAAQAFRDKKGHYIPAPTAQMEDID